MLPEKASLFPVQETLTSSKSRLYSRYKETPTSLDLSFLKGIYATSAKLLRPYRSFTSAPTTMPAARGMAATYRRIYLTERLIMKSSSTSLTQSCSENAIVFATGGTAVHVNDPTMNLTSTR